MTFLAANAISVGRAIFHANTPNLGMCGASIPPKLTQLFLFLFLVKNGESDVEEPEEILSTVPDILFFIDEVTPLVNNERQLSLRYCSSYDRRCSAIARSSRNRFISR